jgi:ABC-2 type transport system ATP-binding protein
MRQKLSLLCTVLHGPELLLLDEPAVGLDPVSRDDIWTVLDEQRDRGVGILLSTAYLDEAERCDTVAMLRDGQLAYVGPPQDLAQRMAGRVFHIPVGEGHARPAMRKVAHCPAVADAIPLGTAIRLSLRADASPEQGQALAADLRSMLKPTPPNLEDGFLDLAGPAETAVPRFLQDYRTFARAPDGPAIVADGLTRYYGAFAAAQNVRFDVAHGEVFGLLGPNGAGKSTVFKMLCGLVRPSGGVGRVAGHDLRAAGRQVRQAFGYMAQRFSLYGDLSVRQNLDYFAGCYALHGVAAEAAIARMIDAYHLQPHVDRDAGSLPLGFRQRLALACAVIHQPGILFLDEPTSGVDPILRREFWSHIDALVDRGVAVLVTTHFMDEAERCDRLTIIHRGRQIATGTPAALKTAAGVPDGTMEAMFTRLLKRSDTQKVAA